MFKINKEQCIKVGQQFAKIQIRNDAFEKLGPSLDDQITRSRIFLYISAICHQTETLQGIIKGKPQRGWDYLMGKFIEIGIKEPLSLFPEVIAKLSTKDLGKMISDHGDEKTSTLTRVEERTNFLRDIGNILEKEYAGNPLLLNSNSFLEGKDGLYAKMKKFSAFSKDPIMKKATVYFMLMNKSGLFPEFKDPENLRPMPDYHKMRLFLRTGCIESVNQEITNKLINKINQNVDVDNNLREATAKAYKNVLAHSKKDFFELEVLLWAFARSLCYHKSLCETETGNGNFLEYANLQSITKCPLESICKKETAYWHPIVNTHYH